jgi:type IV secretory pathway VirB10-like protein
MHEMISGMIEEDEKQEQAPGGTDSATKKTEATQAQEQKTSDKPQEPGNNTPETPTPVPKHGRKPKEKAKPEYKRLPKHRATGNPRLDALETALHDALECLNNTKLAFYVKDIKEVRLALSELYKSWNKPEDERIAELKAGLKAAADKLSANSRAAKSKIMQDIWSDIIVALQNKNSE